MFFSLFEEKLISMERIKENFDIEQEKVGEKKMIINEINQNNLHD